MSTSLENFCPRLRAGRVIPQGSRIIFETDNPYNQIILPMVLADLVLLCSGQFSVREIVEKIYKKQGAVPFKSILKAIHLLHQGAFFENGHELVLNSNLRSWMDPRAKHWTLSWRFGQRIVADRRSPSAFYFFTLFLLIGSLFGLQSFPVTPLETLENWTKGQDLWRAVIGLIACSSLIQTLRHLFRGIQLLLLTGKAYNVSICLSLWGVHLHVGDEANDLFDNRLYAAMFHISQILVGWFCVFCLSPVLDPQWIEPLLIVNMVLSFWETNPFVNSEGLKLIQGLMLPLDREVMSWHFEASNLIRSLGSSSGRQDEDFGRVCATWGTFWLLMCFALLMQTAIIFGPAGLQEIAHWSWSSALPLTGLGLWLTALYSVVQAFVETIVLSVIRPKWRRLHSQVHSLVRGSNARIPDEKILESIQDLPLFSHFHEQNLLKIISNSEVAEFAQGAFIFRQGDASHEIFVLLEGEVQIIRQSASGSNEWLTELAGIAIFGEAALLDDAPRAADVSAKIKTRVLKVPVQGIRQMGHESQAVRQIEDFRNAILVNQFFASSPVFRSLSRQSIEFLSNRGSIEYYDQNHTVFKQGDSGDSIYLMLRGSVVIEIYGKKVKKIGQGSFFGEIALIANIPRTASIHTLEPCVLFKLSADSFWEVLVQNIDLGVFIETISEGRLREDLEIAPPLKSTGTDS